MMSEQSLPPPDPDVIPAHCNPVDFFMAQAEGAASKYRPLASLQEAQGVEHGVMTMVADYGGQVLLSVPAKQVRAHATTLQRLLSDLESITFGSGFNAADSGEIDSANMYFQIAPPGTGLWGGCGGGLVTDGLWLHDELDHELDLRGQIAGILGGLQHRLELPHQFPNQPILSLAQAKMYPRSQVMLRSGREIRDHLTCPAALIQVSETDLLTMIDLIDQWTSKAWPYVVVRDGKPNSVLYYLRRCPSLDNRGSNWNTIHLGFKYLEPIRPQLEAMLFGKRPMIPID